MDWSSMFGVAVSFFGLAALGLYYYQDYLLYYPDTPAGARLNFVDPVDYGLGRIFEEVFFETTDKVHIWAWFFKVPKSTSRPTILFFHGNAGNISHRLPNIAQMIYHLNCNVMIVSYRGYGKSTGFPSEEGIKKDAQAALEYLLTRTDIDKNQIILFGRSLGGAVASYLCSKNQDKIKGLIIENTFLSIPDMISVVFPALSSFKFLATNKWETKHLISNIKVPILFLTGAKDELVPAFHMKQLFTDAASSKNKEIFVFPEGQHMNTWNQPNYYPRLKDFLEKLE